MGIVSVTPDYKSLTARSNLTEDTATVPYFVELTNDTHPLAAPNVALDAPGIPVRYQQHPCKPWMFVEGKEAQIINLFLYRVVVFYRSIANPLDIPPEYEWIFANTNEPVDIDAHGLPMLNSSDETNDPPITVEITDLILRYRRNSATFNPNIALAYLNRSVNDDLFLGVDPGIAHLTRWTGKHIFRPLEYFIETLEIRFRGDGWRVRRLDRGYRTKASTDEVGVEITDDNGQPITQPVLLDGKGARLADNADPVYNQYEIMRPFPYANLNIIL